MRFFACSVTNALRIKRVLTPPGRRHTIALPRDYISSKPARLVYTLPEEPPRARGAGDLGPAKAESPALRGSLFSGITDQRGSARVPMAPRARSGDVVSLWCGGERLRSRTARLPVWVGRAVSPCAPAPSRVCVRGQASRRPSAGGVQEGWSRVGVGAAAPHAAPLETATSGPPPRPSCDHQAYDTRLAVQKEGKYCSLQLTVDAERNRRCVEEGMLHGLRTRAAGSDAEVTVHRTMGIPQGLRPVSPSRTHVGNRVDACDHRHAARSDAPESWCQKKSPVMWTMPVATLFGW